MQSTHPALVLSTPGSLAIEDVPTVQPQAGEVLVKPLRASICGSDLDVLRGARPVRTTIIGHEGVAEVVAVGAGAVPFTVGQRVTFWPNNPNDTTDTFGVDIPGLFQRYLVISRPEVERGLLIACDPTIPLVCAPLLEPLASVLYGRQLMNQVREPKRVAVVGAGAIGLLNVITARAQGSEQVFLVNASQARLDWAVKRGIVAASNALLNTPDLAERLLALTQDQGVEATYLCTPRSTTHAILEQALRYTQEDGCISFTAGSDSHKEAPELPGVDINKLKYANICGMGRHIERHTTRSGKSLWLTGHSGSSPEYIRQAMALVSANPTTYASVITHMVPYRAVPRLVESLLAPTYDHSYGKVIIDLTSESDTITDFDPLVF